AHARSNEVSPGRFELEGEFPDQGNYLVNIVREQAGELTGVLHTGFAVSYSPEFEAGAPNTYLLTRVAETSQGQFDPAPDQVYRPVTAKVEGQNWKDWTLPLLMFVVLLFPLDIAVRRIMLPEEGFRVWMEAAGAVILGVLRPVGNLASRGAHSGMRRAEQQWQQRMERQIQAKGPGAQPAASPTETAPPPSASRAARRPTGDLESRVGDILSGGGTPRSGEDDTYSRLLEAKRRVSKAPEDEKKKQ
ncbi:MAG: hypothetical protein ABI743_04965, partial [bacterium]